MMLSSCNNMHVRARQCTHLSSHTSVKPARWTTVQATRRELGLQMLTIGSGLLGLAGASAAQDEGLSRPVDDQNSSSSSSSTGFIAIAPINSSAKSYMDMRDEAMEYKCSGGMFDCDGDRREFAHKQYMDWLNSGGVPKRIREGRPNGPKSY